MGEEEFEVMAVSYQLQVVFSMLLLGQRGKLPSFT